jgi:hypothetical protein
MDLSLSAAYGVGVMVQTAIKDFGFGGMSGKTELLFPTLSIVATPELRRAVSDAQDVAEDLDPLATAKRRLAEGEITPAEYRQIAGDPPAGG